MAAEVRAPRLPVPNQTIPVSAAFMPSSAMDEERIAVAKQHTNVSMDILSCFGTDSAIATHFCAFLEYRADSKLRAYYETEPKPVPADIRILNRWANKDKFTAVTANGKRIPLSEVKDDTLLCGIYGADGEQVLRIMPRPGLEEYIASVESAKNAKEFKPLCAKICAVPDSPEPFERDPVQDTATAARFHHWGAYAYETQPDGVEFEAGAIMTQGWGRGSPTYHYIGEDRNVPRIPPEGELHGAIALLGGAGLYSPRHWPDDVAHSISVGSTWLDVFGHVPTAVHSMATHGLFSASLDQLYTALCLLFYRCLSRHNLLRQCRHSSQGVQWTLTGPPIGFKFYVLVLPTKTVRNRNEGAFIRLTETGSISSTVTHHEPLLIMDEVAKGIWKPHIVDLPLTFMEAVSIPNALSLSLMEYQATQLKRAIRDMLKAKRIPTDLYRVKEVEPYGPSCSFGGIALVELSDYHSTPPMVHQMESNPACAQ